ncbi:hypothetical protein U9M48_002195 [Paspalum notatum var. saurae]|uniref:Uncharacterized protein n=1 Tax=Paspalum notatum var. saurae TaxID=547442 RepID=A0AAQ3SHA4_PASNO
MEALTACSSNAALAQESGAPVLTTVFFRLDQSPKGAQERLQGFFAFAMSPMFYTCATAPQVDAAAWTTEGLGAVAGSRRPRDARGGERVGRRRSRRPVLVRPADTGKPPKAVSHSRSPPPAIPSCHSCSCSGLRWGRGAPRRGRGRGAPRRGWGHGGSGGRSTVAPRRRPWAARRGHGGVRDARGDATVSEADVRAQAMVEG